LPETELAFPEEQRLAVGAPVNEPPSEEPHWPLVGVGQHHVEDDVFLAEQ
jgi:hypothetical protein